MSVNDTLITESTDETMSVDDTFDAALHQDPLYIDFHKWRNMKTTQLVENSRFLKNINKKYGKNN